MPQESFSLSEVNTSTFRRCKFEPRSIQNNHLKENWKKIRKKGVHVIYLNINSLLSQVDELGKIVKILNPTVIGITETKLDNSIDDS